MINRLGGFCMELTNILDEYNGLVGSWLDQSKKETAAVTKLQKAVATGNLKDLERLRQAARTAADATYQRAANVDPIEFDVASYLSEDGGFIGELMAAAQRAGVKMYERDGVIFCYPFLVRTEPEKFAVRQDKKLIYTLRPETLAADLKKVQGKESKAKSDRFLEALFEGYELVRAGLGLPTYTDVPLPRVYEVLTLLPGSKTDYTLLDFTRDVYFLDSSGITETRKGFRLSLPASTVSKERSSKVLKFVTRDGYEKQYAAVKFTPQR